MDLVKAKKLWRRYKTNRLINSRNGRALICRGELFGFELKRSGCTPKEIVLTDDTVTITWVVGIK